MKCVTLDMLIRVWQKINYRFEILRVTIAALVVNADELTLDTKKDSARINNHVYQILH